MEDYISSFFQLQLTNSQKGPRVPSTSYHVTYTFASATSQFQSVLVTGIILNEYRSAFT